jgi:hypothetical protein
MEKGRDLVGYNKKRSQNILVSSMDWIQKTVLISLHTFVCKNSVWK